MNRDQITAIVMVVAAIGIIHSTINQHIRLPHSLEVVEQEKARVRQSLNSTESTVRAVPPADSHGLLSSAHKELQQQYDHIVAETSKAKQDRKMLVSGLHDMIEKGLLHPPDYVLSALRNATAPPEGSAEQKKGFQKLMRAVTKWRKNAALFEVKTKEAEAMLARLRAERKSLDSKARNKGKQLEAILKEVNSIDIRAAPATALTDHSHHHPILATSDKDFRALPISQWLQKSVYGDGGDHETGGNGKTGKGTCEGDFGTTLITRWREVPVDMCDPIAIDAKELHGKAEPRQLADHSSVTCRPLLQTQHTGSDVLCTMKNVAVNYGALSDEAQTSEVMKNYVASKHEDQAYLHWKPGLIRGSCNKNQHWAEIKIPGWNKDLMESFEAVTAPKPPPPPPPTTTPRPPPPPTTTPPPPPAPLAQNKSGGLLAVPIRPSPPPSAAPAAAPIPAKLGDGLPPLRPEVKLQVGSANLNASASAPGPAVPGGTARPEIRLQPGAGGAVLGTKAVGGGGVGVGGVTTAVGRAAGRRVMGEEGKEWWRVLECGEWEEKATIIIERDTFANFYHDSEDVFNAFLVLGILQLKLDDVQIILLDFYPHGPFWEIWSSVFGAGVLTAWDVKEKYGARNMCYRNLILNIIGPASPFTIHTSVTPCPKAPLVRAYADFLVRGMRLHHLTPFVRPKPLDYVVVTWMTRKSSVKWPERAFCDDKFFKCDLFKHLDMRQLGRVVKNDEDVAKKLQDLDNQEYHPPRRVVVQTKDYNVMSLADQMANDIITDVMVGPHGAGLMHSVFMGDRAMLIELGIDGSSGLKHFENLQKWRRSADQYYRLTTKNPVDVDLVFNKVREMVGKVDISSY